MALVHRFVRATFNDTLSQVQAARTANQTLQTIRDSNIANVGNASTAIKAEAQIMQGIIKAIVG